MQHFKKFFLFSAFSLALVSCGGGGSSGGGGTASTPPAATPTPTPPPTDLPPDPGSAGDATLAGIDSNNNDVRDDVERAIHARHPDDQSMRTMLMNVASGLQDSLMAGNSGSEAALNQAGNEGGKAVGCLAMATLNWDIEYDFVAAEVVNTGERRAAFRQFNAAMNNRRFRIPDDDPCR